MPPFEEVPLSPFSADTWHKTLSQTDGRDKVFRLIQYTCKLLRGIKAGSAKPEQSSVASNILAVESAMSTSRQIWRLFKWASIYAKRRNSLAAVPQLPDIAGLLSDLGMFGYYLSDNYSFLCKVGVTRGNVGIASRRAARFWLAAVLAGLVGSVIKAVELHRRQQVAVRRITEARAKKNDGDGDEQTEGAETTSPDECIPPPELRHLVRLKRAALALCAKHLSDAIVASSLSRENQAHPAIVGACGVVSSIVGCWQVWPRHTRSGTIG